MDKETVKYFDIARKVAEAYRNKKTNHHDVSHAEIDNGVFVDEQASSIKSCGNLQNFANINKRSYNLL